MAEPGRENNYGSISDPILPPSPDANMESTELNDLPNTSQHSEQSANTSELAEPLKCEDVEVDKLPDEMELNKVYETIG